MKFHKWADTSAPGQASIITTTMITVLFIWQSLSSSPATLIYILEISVLGSGTSLFSTAPIRRYSRSSCIESIISNFTYYPFVCVVTLKVVYVRKKFLISLLFRHPISSLIFWILVLEFSLSRFLVILPYLWGDRISFYLP